jgi:hypothetical protein
MLEQMSCLTSLCFPTVPSLHVLVQVTCVVASPQEQLLLLWCFSFIIGDLASFHAFALPRHVVLILNCHP